MPVEHAMTFIQTLGLAMGAAWVSGINLYATVATLGLLGRFGNLTLPGELGELTNWWVIGLATALYCIEFVADKVPYVDNVWDVVHTFIRVPAGAVVAAGAFGDFDPTVKTVALLLGGGLALSSHGTKMATRTLINVSPEPVTNAIASFVEDVLAVVTVVLAYLLPVLAIVIVGIGLIVTLLLLPRIIRAMRAMFSFLRGKKPQASP